MRKKWAVWAFSFWVLFAFGSTGSATDGNKQTRDLRQIILTPDKLQWGKGPEALPGAQVAVLEGDPNRPGFFVMRLKLQEGTKIPPHVHRNVERVTVISGRLNLVMGEKSENAIVLPEGSYFSLPANTVHNAWADEETILQIGTMGPWTFEPVGKEIGKK